MGCANCPPLVCCRKKKNLTQIIPVFATEADLNTQEGIDQESREGKDPNPAPIGNESRLSNALGMASNISNNIKYNVSAYVNKVLGADNKAKGKNEDADQEIDD